MVGVDGRREGRVLSEHVIPQEIASRRVIGAHDGATVLLSCCNYAVASGRNGCDFLAVTIVGPNQLTGGYTIGLHGPLPNSGDVGRGACHEHVMVSYRDSKTTIVLASGTGKHLLPNERASARVVMADEKVVVAGRLLHRSDDV